jgi:hypothetical protein
LAGFATIVGGASATTLARELIAAAKESVGSLQTAPFELEVRYAGRDISGMRNAREGEPT